MTHDDIEVVVSAYVDGELDADATADLERHLPTCASCVAMVATYRDHSSSVRNHLQATAATERAPDILRRRVVSILGGGTRRTWTARAAVAGLAAALIVAAGIGGGLLATRGTRGTRAAGDDQVTREILDSHIRSLAGGGTHLTDVTSTDQHTVKPWFTGKLDFAPPVVDLADAGFPLLGGRIDYIDGHQAAALVYGRRQHRINLYEWPAAAAAASVNMTAELRRGYTMLNWTRAGTEYWAVSDVNPADLRQFAWNLSNAVR